MRKDCLEENGRIKTESNPIPLHALNQTHVKVGRFLLCP